MFDFNKKPNTPSESKLEDIKPSGDFGDYPAKHLLEVLEKRKKHIQEAHERDAAHSVGLDSEQ